MNWDTIQGQWNQWTGKIRQKWGELTDDDIAQMKGQRDQIVGKIQEKYGRTKEEVQKEVDEFFDKS